MRMYVCPFLRAREADIAKSFCQLCCCSDEMWLGLQRARLGSKMMGLVVAVGIINMAETRPTSERMRPRKVALLKS